jgi:hypothetical protein
MEPKKIITIDGEGRPRIIGLARAVEKWHLTEVTQGGDMYFLDVVKLLADRAPNIALNIQGSTASPSEFWTWTVFGIAC